MKFKQDEHQVLAMKYWDLTAKERLSTIVNLGQQKDICEQSSKLITFIDLAGHHKYLRTTIFGLTGHSPDFAMLVVAGNAGIVGTTKEHLGLAMALKVPTFVIVNKT
ncbi:GTP binding protein [Desmophyllum pertusum]|uniref:GTP binding protein n=1 Tax=Desmophyllum pertusum TaxID=174260 RepID=A0A9X0CIW2_9CNID|nr:GTP binding protein [Desmophyllum pertusum]